MDDEALIKVNNISRLYGKTLAVDDISFEVSRGEVLGFLGPNGAGKSTTMRVITGNLAPSTGSVVINGIDILDQPKLAKADLGYLPEQPPVYKDLSVDEYLKHCAKLNRITKNKMAKSVERAKVRCGLEQVGKRLIGNLSKGYQQRVGIAQAIIHAPSVVVLDEPTVGLDPIQIREIRTLIRELGNDHSVILSTHILPEVQATCSRVQIINKGKLVLSDNIEGLQRRMQTSSLIIGLKNAPDIDALQNTEFVSSVSKVDDRHFRVHHAPDESPAEQLAQTAVENGWGLFELSPERVSLEEVFVNITCSEGELETKEEANSA